MEDEILSALTRGSVYCDGSLVAGFAPKTFPECVAAMLAIEGDDTEGNHAKADAILCRAILELAKDARPGAPPMAYALVKAFAELEKWYA